MTAEDIRTLIRYSGWATRLLLDAAATLSPDDLMRDVGVSHTSIFKTLAHTYWADAVWFTRVANPNETIHEPKTLPELKLRWSALQTGWEEWADDQDDGTVQVNIVYKGLTGAEFENSVGHLVTHVVNHATLHRGQVMGMIRQLGVAPPHTDFLYYIRELAAERALAE